MRLAIDLGGTQLRVGARADTGAWAHLHRERREPGFSPQHLVDRLREVIAKGSWRRQPSASLSPPSSLRTATSEVRGLGWAEVPSAPSCARLSASPTTIETDVFCGAFYEIRSGAAHGLSSALYISVGTGVGHAIIIDGKLYARRRRQRSWPPDAAARRYAMLLRPQGLSVYRRLRSCSSRSGAPRQPIEYLAQAIGAAVTFFEPHAVILSGGALNQPWFALDPLVAAIPQPAFPAARPEDRSVARDRTQSAWSRSTRPGAVMTRNSATYWINRAYREGWALGMSNAHHLEAVQAIAGAAANLSAPRRCR